MVDAGVNMVDTKDASVGNKPTAAFALTLLGGILVLLGGIAVMILGSIGTMTINNVQVGHNVGRMFGLIGVISGIIMIVAAVFMNSTNKSKVKEWSIVALVFTLISLGNGGGFILGFILGLIGSILGLVYKG